MTACSLTSAGRTYRIADLRAYAGADLERLPWSHRILLENILRTGAGVPEAALRSWLRSGASDAEIPFRPGRVMMHDTTCGPALVDIAASRNALAEAGGDPSRLSPVLPVDVSTDHSIAVDHFGAPDALRLNMAKELERNRERYAFMKWAAQSLGNVTVHPPGTGIMHTINMERLASVVATAPSDQGEWAMPDTLIGTDSHTPMINGLGVLGWGVGGLEAESVMFGLAVSMRVPKVVGVRLTGAMPPGTFATDLALLVTSALRTLGVAGRFVEFFGPGVSTLTIGARAVVANMAPEYGSTTGYFPIDERTLAYLSETGRPAEQIRLVEDYARRQGLWFDPSAHPTYDQVLEIDLASVVPSVAGPQRPQDLLPASATGAAVAPLLPAGAGDGPLPAAAVAIASITSCTNTTDPRLLVAAGLLARKARALGLASKPWVKTSLAPGSPTAERYLRRAGLLGELEALGFAIVGYGCAVCIGNSGPLTPVIDAAADAGATLPVAILSGNRNFPGRVHPRIEAAFLASPPLVVAWALAGDAGLDITADPIGTAADGRPLFLADLWPSDEEIDAALAQASAAEDYDAAYEAAEASAAWQAIEAPTGALYPWDDASSYLRRPPFAAADLPDRLGHYTAHPLIVLGDDVTTDHISPAGAVPTASEAAEYLIAKGEDARDLNVFSARRGNWEAMVRGLFTNRAVRNLLRPGIAPGHSVHGGTGTEAPLWRVAELYRQERRSVVVVAGDRYGMGSSRDWAAKGVALLGVRAVLAVGFERIHRSNLVNMGILPLLLPAGFHPAALGLAAEDRFEIEAAPSSLVPRGSAPVTIHRHDGSRDAFLAEVAVETEAELDILRKGGMIPAILKRMMPDGQRGA